MSEDQRTVFIFNKTKETFLAYRVRIADSILSRLIGLLGKRSLEPDSGLWIIPSRGIHTLGMLFDIDVIYLDKDLKVVGLRELVRPFSITALHLNAESVLELPAHTIFKSRTEVGDEFIITSFDSVSSLEAGLPTEVPKAEPSGKVVNAR